MFTFISAHVCVRACVCVCVRMCVRAICVRVYLCVCLFIIWNMKRWFTRMGRLCCLTGCSGMDVIMASPKNVTALNGTEVKISCIFQSCYKMDPSVFVMNWTFQETKNDTEKMVRNRPNVHDHDRSGINS